MTTKKLTQKQIKWAEFLSKSNFEIKYQGGKKNNKANALTKKLNKQLTDNNRERIKHKMKMLLPPKHIKMHFIEVSNQALEKIVKNRMKILPD